MTISNNLILDLVKKTNNKKNTKKETFAQGVIVRNEKGEVCVKIYGTDVATPVSLTTNIDANKPVTVMIKNHTATVIGNVSTDVNEAENSILNSTQSDIVYIDEATINEMWNEYENNKRRSI